MYTTIQKIGVSDVFVLLLSKGALTWSKVKDIYIMKDFLFKWLLFFWTFL